MRVVYRAESDAQAELFRAFLDSYGIAAQVTRDGRLLPVYWPSTVATGAVLDSLGRWRAETLISDLAAGRRLSSPFSPWVVVALAFGMISACASYALAVRERDEGLGEGHIALSLGSPPHADGGGESGEWASGSPVN